MPAQRPASQSSGVRGAAANRSADRRPSPPIPKAIPRPPSRTPRAGARGLLLAVAALAVVRTDASPAARPAGQPPGLWPAAQRKPATTAVRGAHVRVRFLKLFGERHTATTYLENQLVAPRLRAPEFLLPSGCPGKAKWGGVKAIPSSCAELVLSPRPRDCVALALSRRNCERLKLSQRADRYFHEHFWVSLGWKHAVPPLPVIMFPLVVPGGHLGMPASSRNATEVWQQLRHHYDSSFGPVSHGASSSELRAPSSCAAPHTPCGKVGQRPR